MGLHSDAITRCRDQLGGSPSVSCPLGMGMDLTAWFGPQGVFSSGGAAHIFGSGPVPRRFFRRARLLRSSGTGPGAARCSKHWHRHSSYLQPIDENENKQI
jgi:hypothetical protein